MEQEVSRLRARVTELEAENARLFAQLALARAAPAPRPPSAAATPAAPPPPDGSSVCDNCGRAVPAATFSMHRLHCARNVSRCGLCALALPARELDAHLAAARGSPAQLAGAAAAGNVAAVEGMLRHGLPAAALCDGGAAADDSGAANDTALHIAARHRRVAVMEVLLARGCPPNAPNASGETPLHAACSSREPPGAHEGPAAASPPPADPLLDVVALLVRAGGDAEAKNVLGDTPMQVAQRARNSDVLLLLSSSGGALPGRPSSAPGAPRSRPGSAQQLAPIARLSK